MKFITRIFVSALFMAHFCAWADGPVPGTVGSNLTAYNNNMGAVDNNYWNQLTNSRTAPSADFGNCNALILRCAQPKCATGGCVSMEIAYPIVSGCVMSNESCAKHGDALIQTIAAQIVANSTAKASEQAASAQASAALAAAAQSGAQMQAMQDQMQQMQSQMAAQSAQQAAAVQAALEEQKQIAAQAARDAAEREEAARAAAAAATASPAANVAQAVSMGVSADVLAREKAGGQIMTQLENATTALKSLKGTMQNVFDYARCDASGNNCAGPKRVKVFKEKASDFFDPYETVLDEVYDALIMAQSLGVDITDIYMLLNGSCNVWGKYMCEVCDNPGISEGEYNAEGKAFCEQSETGGKNYWTVAKVLAADNSYKVAPRQRHCTLMQMLNNNDDVQQNWLDMGAGSSGGIRVACASDAIENSILFRGRKKQASINIETLQRIIEQDAPTRASVAEIDKYGPSAVTRFCSVGDDDIPKLQVLVQKKALTMSGRGFTNVCVKDNKQLMDVQTITGANIPKSSCETTIKKEDHKTEDKEDLAAYRAAMDNCKKDEEDRRIKCNQSNVGSPKWDGEKCICTDETTENVGGECVERSSQAAKVVSYVPTRPSTSNSSLGTLLQTSTNSSFELEKYGTIMAGHCYCGNPSIIKKENSCLCF